MTPKTLLLLLGGPFMVFGVYSMLGYFQSREILRLVGTVDPDKWRELSPVRNPLLRGTFWMNPLAFERYIDSDDWKGNKLLEAKIGAYKESGSRAGIAWKVFMLELLLLIVWLLL